MLATQLIARLRQRFQLEIPLDALCTSQTVAGLADQIAVLGQYSQEEIEQLLDQLEQLSDDQVQQLRDGVSS